MISNKPFDLIGDELASGLIVDFVAVIFLRVMGGGDHDAPASVDITDRIRKFGGRP
jgi:hypothetical protein